MSYVKMDIWFLSIKKEIILIKMISFNFTLNILAQYHMMKTTIAEYRIQILFIVGNLTN